MLRTLEAISARAFTRLPVRTPDARRHGRKARLQLKTLEDRLVPATVTITPLADAVEGGTAKFRVSRDDLAGGSLNVNLTQSGTADSSDVSFVTMSIVPIGAYYVDVALPTNTDTLFEGPQTIVLTIAAGSYTIGTPAAAAVTVVDLNAPLDTPADPSVCFGPDNLAQASIGIAGAASSTDGVRYADGSVSASFTDLHSGGFGQSTGIERAWTNAIGYDAAGFDGGGVISGQIPYLRTDGTRVLAATGGIQSTWFDKSGSTFTPRHMTQDTLTENTGAKEFTQVTSAGARLVYNNFDASLPTNQKGQIKSVTDPDGNVTAVFSVTTDGKPVEVRRNSGSTVESYLYAYVASGTNAGKIASVTLRRSLDGGSSWTTVRTAEYTYYDTGSSNGPAGSLQLAVVKDAAGTVIDTRYARFYTSSSSTGYTGALKYSFSADSYERLKAAYPTPDTATDAQVSAFASDYFEYDAVQRVTKHIQQGTGCSSCAGGLGSSTFAYTTSIFPDGYNSYRMKTVETRADGNTTTVYTNYVGQPILEVYKDVVTGQEWSTYHRYDAAGREVLTAMPSAVSGYDPAYADLVRFVSGNDYQHLRDAQGLILTTSYGTSTTANSMNAGNVAGYVHQTRVQRGDGGAGTPVSELQSTTQYFSHSDGSLTVYPVATQTQYRNTNGTGEQTTAYAYLFGASIQPERVTTTLPTVTTGQNGPGTATSSTVVFDDRGRVIWEKDAGGFLIYTAYDEPTGAVTKVIRDVMVDAAHQSTYANLPAGWVTPAGGGLHQTTTYEVDSLGRTTKVTDPNGHLTYTVYKDSSHEIRVYSGWNTSTNAPTGPTMVSREDRALGYTETLTMSATPTVVGGRPTGAEAISDIKSLSRQVMNEAHQTVYQDQYFNLAGVTYSQSSVTLGTSGTNYNRIQMSYDTLGQQSRTLTPAGTIHRTVYDGLGRPVSSWVGLYDTPTSGFWSPTNTAGTDLVKVSENQYDGGGVGDGNLTQTTSFAGGTAANRVNQFSYDWRDRLVATKAGVEGTENTSVNRPITYQVRDNRGQMTESYQYDGDGLSITTDATGDGIPDQPSAGALRAKSTAAYDELGRVYQENAFSVDPSTGAVSTNALTVNHWFDARGNEIKTSSPGGLVSKAVFNGLGWPTTQSTTDGGGDNVGGYADADDVTGDVVLTQSETLYDLGGNALQVATRDRFHDLNDSLTGALGTPTTGVNARVSYQVMYYDLADRPTASVDVGTNGGAAYTRPGTVPVRSDSVRVTEQAYNPAGWQETVTDPKGLIDQTFYDLAGRTTKTVENYVDGTVSDADDKTVEYTYGPAGVTEVKARLTGGGVQTTTYRYGTNTGMGSTINDNDHLWQIVEPNPTTGELAGSADYGTRAVYLYNNLGEPIFHRARGTVHKYLYDVVGRMVSDPIYDTATGVDWSVLRIETAYDGQGNPFLITSYDATTGGTIVNQVQREYNGLGQLTKEYQALNGAVNTSTSPYVGYTYSEMAGPANHSRLTQLAYPTATGTKGKTVVYGYGSGLNDRISRLEAQTVGTTTVESYDYLGLGTVVGRKHPQVDVDLTYVKQSGESDGEAGDKYTGLDRFGRVADQRWRRMSGTVADLDRRVYTYDRNGSRLYAENASSQAGSAARSEAFAYDGLDQLTQYQRGTLTKAGGVVTGITSVTRTQTWDLDAVGNFDSQTTNTTTQTRTHDRRNQILTVSGATTPTYDFDGNLTRQENGKAQVYDAWNRLVQVKASPTGSVLTTYEYDGLGRRVSWTTGVGAREFYYSDDWQVLEERVSGVARDQYVWSPVYVDALVLRDEDADVSGALEQRIYALQDANFNVRALVAGGTGLVIERYAYDPYGEATPTDSAYTVRTSSSYNWQFLHQGLKWHATADLYDVRHRAYSATLGRWLQNDPMGFAAGDANLYRYVSNNPASAFDPLGLIEWRADLWDKNAKIVLADAGPVTTALANAASDARKFRNILATIPPGSCEAPLAADEKYRQWFLERVRKWFVSKADKNHPPSVELAATTVADKLIKLDVHYNEMGHLRFTWTRFADIAQTRPRIAPNTIYVNQRGIFFTMVAKNRQGTIIHELTHLLIGTSDHGYIHSVAHPDQYDGGFRTSNADNYQYWFEDYYL